MRIKRDATAVVVMVLVSMSMPLAGAAQSATAKADAKVWENYDFVPGSKVIFYTDFSEDRVGNFARGLKIPDWPRGGRPDQRR